MFKDVVAFSAVVLSDSNVNSPRSRHPADRQEPSHGGRFWGVSGCGRPLYLL